MPYALRIVITKKTNGDRTKRENPHPNALLNFLLCLKINFLRSLDLEYSSLSFLNRSTHLASRSYLITRLLLVLCSLKNLFNSFKSAFVNCKYSLSGRILSSNSL